MPFDLEELQRRRRNLALKRFEEHIQAELAVRQMLAENQTCNFNSRYSVDTS